MNKAAACIKLIQILSVRNDYINTEELADLLETNPRNVREYIKELEVCGYTLESMKG
jgi:predicted DNA-binding transcriptional regulator YafY